ncbi:MAG: hypothetical protein HN392_11850 [Anaerolineae bacterium]|jgi:hypothetical protein|nr:hypothetical protein [Anaerolineae bacterium]MBT7074405.1 hypothetical protein [Anaerolineae bacterium]MBT7782813.1 hypothetical protein [Anaerolineae bacterium]
MQKKHLFPLIIILILFTLGCSLFNPELVDKKEETPTETNNESTPAQETSATHDSPCNNILYPLIPDQQLVYRIDKPEGGNDQIGLTVASVNGSTATIDMLVLSTGILSQSTIECDAGAIKEYPLATMDTIFGDMVDGTLTNEYISGVIAPSEETLVANDWDMSWESQYIMNGEMTFSEEGETFTAHINNSPVIMNWSVDSIGQSLTVPAGNYTNVVIVKRDMTSDFSIDMDGMVLESTIVFKSTHWFEPYVGMLKMTMDSATVEVQGMTFPISLGETMELVEFRPAE